MLVSLIIFKRSTTLCRYPSGEPRSKSTNTLSNFEKCPIMPNFAVTKLPKLNHFYCHSIYWRQNAFSVRILELLKNRIRQRHKWHNEKYGFLSEILRKRLKTISKDFATCRNKILENWGAKHCQNFLWNYGTCSAQQGHLTFMLGGLEQKLL